MALRVSEAELQSGIIAAAHAYGYKVAHFRPAKTAKGWRTAVAADGRGFPDLVIAKPGRLIFAELKSSVGLLTDAQRGWIESLPNAYVWTPKDWPDRIHHILKDGPPPRPQER